MFYCEAFPKLSFLVAQFGWDFPFCHCFFVILAVLFISVILVMYSTEINISVYVPVCFSKINASVFGDLDSLCSIFQLPGPLWSEGLISPCHINTVAVHWYQLHSTSSMRLCRHKEVNYLKLLVNDTALAWQLQSTYQGSLVEGYHIAVINRYEIRESRAGKDGEEDMTEVQLFWMTSFKDNNHTPQWQDDVVYWRWD